MAAIINSEEEWIAIRRLAQAVVYGFPLPRGKIVALEAGRTYALFSPDYGEGRRIIAKWDRPICRFHGCPNGTDCPEHAENQT